MEPVSDRIIEYLQTEKKYVLLQITESVWHPTIKPIGFYTFEELQDYVRNLLKSHKIGNNLEPHQLLDKLRDTQEMSVRLLQLNDIICFYRSQDSFGNTYKFQWFKISDL